MGWLWGVHCLRVRALWRPRMHHSTIKQVWPSPICKKFTDDPPLWGPGPLPPPNNKRTFPKRELEGVDQILIDGNNKLKSSFKSSDRTGTSAAEVMTDWTATGLSQRINTEPIRSRERGRKVSIECQKRKPPVIEKSLGEVPLPTKMPRLTVSLSKQATKREEIQC